MLQENKLDVICCVHASKKDKHANEEVLYNIFKSMYVPILMHKWSRPAVVVIFFGWLCLSISVAPHIGIGLDQELSMAEDSYVLKYFKVSEMLLFRTRYLSNFN